MATPFPGYAITLFFKRGGNPPKVSQIDLHESERDAALYTFAALIRMRTTIAATLEGPDGVVLAEHGLNWEAQG